MADWGLIGTIVSIVIGIIALILQITDKIPEKYARKFWYKISNKKFKIKINTMKKYPRFDIKIDALKINIQNKLREMDIGIEDQVYASNYIQILLKNLQAPYLIKFMPEVDPNHPERRTTVTINLLGTIDFRYNDNIDNRRYITDIDEFFKIIEATHNVHANYENYNLISTKLDYISEQTSNETIKEDSSVINIGNDIINIHSRSLPKLYDVFKKNAAAI